MSATKPDPKKKKKEGTKIPTGASQSEWERKQAPVPAEEGGQTADQQVPRPQQEPK
ncbi:MAG TPA: hypothetical protein VH044_16460 [Polyangiaceae bacterium]|jgi:hypothetical protein|nr:hypothetical protein [Polyangiaceae bacterium]